MQAVALRVIVVTIFNEVKLQSCMVGGGCHPKHSKPYSKLQLSPSQALERDDSTQAGVPRCRPLE